MPELPEVQTVVSELDRKLRGKKIVAVSVRTPKVISIGPATVSNIRNADARSAARFAALLKGQKIASVSRRAKLLVFDLSGSLSMLVHLKMTGQFIYEDENLRAKTGGAYRIINRANAPLHPMPSKYTHVVFDFGDGSRLYFNDVRQFGYLKAVRDDEIAQVKELQNYGPEPLDRKFTFEVFRSILKRRPTGKIKQVLMDSSLIAGIGNIYSDEILFHAKVRPMRAVTSLKKQETRDIYKNIGTVLKKAIEAKGSSVGDFVRTDGSWGQMGKFHYVYGRSGELCKVCGTEIKSVKMNGRTGSYCPKCQK